MPITRFSYEEIEERLESAADFFCLRFSVNEDSYIQVVRLPCSTPSLHHTQFVYRSVISGSPGEWKITRGIANIVELHHSWFYDAEVKQG